MTAGLGIVFDAWFLLLYSGASPARFQACINYRPSPSRLTWNAAPLVGRIRHTPILLHHMQAPGSLHVPIGRMHDALPNLRRVVGHVHSSIGNLLFSGHPPDSPIPRLWMP